MVLTCICIESFMLEMQPRVLSFKWSRMNKIKVTRWLVTCIDNHEVSFHLAALVRTRSVSVDPYRDWLNGNSPISVGKCGPLSVTAWQLFRWCGRSGIVTSRLFPSVKRGAARHIFDPEITSPLNFLWPPKDCLMKAFDFSLFREPLLRVDADLLSVREIYLRGPSPHTLLQMAHCCCSVTSNTPPLFLMPPTPTTSPRATGAESEGEMDDVVLNCDMSPCEAFHYYS